MLFLPKSPSLGSGFGDLYFIYYKKIFSFCFFLVSLSLSSTSFFVCTDVVKHVLLLSFLYLVNLASTWVKVTQLLAMRDLSPSGSKVNWSRDSFGQ